MAEPSTAEDYRPAEQPRTTDAAWLDVEVEWGRRQPVVLVRGELDLLTAPLLGSVLEHVRRACMGPVLVDLRQVSFIDSAGAAPLWAHDVHVQTASRTVLRLLHLFDLVDRTGRTPPGCHGRTPATAA